MTLYLKRHDAQDSSLALSVVAPQIVRQRAGTAERAPAVARGLPVGRSLALTGSESAKYLVGMAAWGSTAAQGAPALDLVEKIRRLAVADPPFAVALPEQFGRLIEVVNVGTNVDDIEKRPTVLTERLECTPPAFAMSWSIAATIAVAIT